MVKKLLNRILNGKELPPEDLGRNDKCHCGSGKKYKHCHYEKDHKVLLEYRAKKLRGAVK